MTTPNSAPSAQAAQKKSGWGSVWSNAVAGIESRLDTILADDAAADNRPRISEIADAKDRAEEEAEAARRAKAVSSAVKEVKANDGRARGNDRLAERLARATAKKNEREKEKEASSVTSSRPENPVVKQNGTDAARTSVDETSVDEKSEDVSGAPTVDETGVEIEHTAKLPGSTEENASARVSIERSRTSTESSPRVSAEQGLPNGTATEPHLQSEEITLYLEKIDALQAKLTYLAEQTVAAAKEANASSTSDFEKHQLLAKDSQIAQLMQEGEKLSKAELRHLATIKKLRVKASEDDKAALENRKKIEKAEATERELRGKLRRAEAVEKTAQEKSKQIELIETQVEELRQDRENAAELVRNLTVQKKEAQERAEKAEKEVKSQSEKGEKDRLRVASLENELEDANIERALIKSRGEKDAQALKEERESETSRWEIRELELRNEISSLENKVEGMRRRVEEDAVDGSSDASGQVEVKLLRQVETLQSQYSLAKENWESIEASLHARLVVLEGERDESLRREGEARKKAREVSSKARSAQDENETLGERMDNLQAELNDRIQEVRDLNENVKRERQTTEEVNVMLSKERQEKHELQARVETLTQQQPPYPPRADSSRRTHTPTELKRPGSSRLTTERLLLNTESHSRSLQSRSMAYPSLPANANIISPPVLSRQESSFSTDPNSSMPPTPSIEIAHSTTSSQDSPPTPTGPALSPSGTLADLVSVSTLPSTGPSVQLVERMSTLIRRLEAEKASTKDEVARLLSQRDDARDEVVTLMREVESKRSTDAKVKGVQEELEVLRARHEASLEMLGEREEEVVELRADVAEMKRLYKELVQEKVGLGAGMG